MENLIDTYVHEVGSHLPEKTRLDIEKEIRSTIEDMLDDTSKAQGKAPDHAMIVEILKRMGPPEKMAASYLPPRYLVGPQLYPTFMLVLRIALTVVIILGGVGFGIALGQTTPTPSAITSAIGNSLANLFNALLLAVGNIVVVFAILQRFLPEMKEIKPDWDPEKMKPVPDSDRFRPFQPVVNIVFTILALMIFNLYPQLVGIGFTINGQWVYTPILAEGFFRVLPWLNILWVLDIVFQLVLLIRGRWEMGTRLFEVLLDVCRVGVTYLMVTGPALVKITTAGLPAGSAQGMAILPDLINLCIRFGLAVALIVTIVTIGVKIFKLLRPATLSLA
jgi:hypothetical protein